MRRAVFLHGFGADRLTWAGNLAAVARGSVLTPDLRGHGTAVAALGDGSLDDLVAGVLEAMGDGPPVWLIGHSLGGGIAARLAAAQPERVAGLVLLAPLGLGRNVDFARLARYAEIEEAEEMMAFLRGLVCDARLIKPEFATYGLEQLNAPGARDALRRIFTQLPDMIDDVHSALSRLAATDLPVTTFWGAADSLVQADAARLAALGDLVMLPEVGHIVHVEAAGVVNAHLRAKLAGG